VPTIPRNCKALLGRERRPEPTASFEHTVIVPPSVSATLPSLSRLKDRQPELAPSCAVRAPIPIPGPRSISVMSTQIRFDTCCISWCRRDQSLFLRTPGTSHRNRDAYVRRRRFGSMC